MKQLLIVFALALLTGCSTVVPVAAKFPEAPGQLNLQSCPNLTKLKDVPQLSEISTTINVNYTAYYECAVKLETWIEWYYKQRSIFEHVSD
jgi:hypothetical protein